MSVTFMYLSIKGVVHTQEEDNEEGCIEWFDKLITQEMLIKMV
jgi:hypothetical protein